MSDSPAAQPGVTIEAAANIRLEVYDSDAEALADDVEPRAVMEMSNVSCIGLHEYIPALLNSKNDIQKVEDPPTRVAFGSDASAFSSADTSLNNRVGSISLTDPANSGTEWSCSELLGQLELNDENLRELGVESAGGVLWNHAALPTPLEPKTSNDAVIVDISISFSAP